MATSTVMEQRISQSRNGFGIQTGFCWGSHKFNRLHGLTWLQTVRYDYTSL